jgi:phage shock protein C
MENTETKEQKRLYRSKTNRIFAGICGGLGEYLDVDPVMLRLVWTLIVVFTGIFPGVIAYFIAIFIVPEKQVGTV